MDVKALRDQVERLAPWHFRVPLEGGLTTVDGNDPGKGQRVSVIDPQELRPLLKRIYPDGLAGRTFLDVACNGGGYSVVAQQLGASETFGFDSREHWIRQATFLADHLGLATARFEQAPLHAATLDQDFDICLFKGILYHLPDPVHALETVCDRTREVIIVDTETEGVRGDLCFRLNGEGTESLMTGMHGLAWWPSGPDLIAEVLSRLGFPESREVFWRAKTLRKRPQAGRCRVVAARSASALAAFDANPIGAGTSRQGGPESPEPRADQAVSSSGE